MIANGKESTWHSKISHQINTPQMGSPKPEGLCLLQFRNKKGWGKEQMDTCFSTLPPYAFKISYKALVSSSKHGVIFIHLLLNNLVAYWTSVSCTCIKVPTWLGYTFIFPFVVSQPIFYIESPPHCSSLPLDFPGGSDGKASVYNAGETRVWSLGREDPLEKEMAIHTSTIAW